ncbi:MbcA/ParS/Xre antitoxin family protein [Klebsiella aerogenes]|nr:MbcA/ParS/Xre antitoxin family protein [Klebsiella aerogenes]
MAVKGNTARRDESFLDIKTVNGDELHTLTTRADSEYLVIDLGNISERHTGFDETLKVAMNAAVNAVIASMGIVVPGVRARKAAGAPKVVKSAGEAVTQADKQGRAERNAQRREALNTRILADSEWLSAKELSEKAQFKNTNPSAGPNRWKSAGRIFAIQINGKDKYPGYALDEGYRPVPVVKQVISVFGEKKTPWGLAIWFGSANSWLGGKKPKDVLKTMPGQVLQAAQAELDGGAHG